MPKLMLSFVALLAIAVASGCNHAKLPGAAANDVAAAQAMRASEVADAKPDVAMAQADGDHKVALQKCDALSGDSRKACKDQADVKYN